MHVYQFPENARHGGTWAHMVSDLLESEPIHTGEWQAMNTSASPMHATHELEDVSLYWDHLPAVHVLPVMVPNIDLSWAAEHFAERVSGIPWNPAPSHVRWPYAVRGNADHTRCPTCDSPNPAAHPATQAEGEVTHICPDTFHSGLGGKFDHTYPERFWPGHAGHSHGPEDLWSDSPYRIDSDICGGREGIRFHYGDLDDVVDLLMRSPLTRQAYLPVWFPEDTGATRGQRVPCTLGYHFMQRGGRLSCRYYLRSCDVYRHLSNDVYFAAMLTHWVARQVTERTSGAVTFDAGSLAIHISSLHAFVADVPKIQARLDDIDQDRSTEMWGAV